MEAGFAGALAQVEDAVGDLAVLEGGGEGEAEGEEEIGALVFGKRDREIMSGLVGEDEPFDIENDSIVF